MRLLLLPLVLVSLLAACSKPAPAPEPVRAVRTLTVQAGSANLLHEYPAEVRARAESRPAFRVGGKLVKRQVNVGDVVKAGQALAEIDPGDLRLGQDAARASLSAAQAGVWPSLGVVMGCPGRCAYFAWRNTAVHRGL